MKVSEIMTQEVIMANPQDSVVQAARLMRDHDIGSLPVSKNEKLLGMITDRDIVVRGVAERNKALAEITVQECMSSTIHYCFEDDGIEEVGQQMAQAKLRRLPVLNMAKRLVGIVSLGDLSQGEESSAVVHHTLEQISQPN